MSSVSGNPVTCVRLVTFRLVCLGLHAPNGAPLANLSPSQSLTNQEAGLYLPIFHLFREYSAVTKLYVGNLPFTVTDEAVRTLFSTHGTVDKVSLITDRDTGRPRGFGFVEMSNADASRAMQALNGTDFEGRPLRVSEAQDRQRPGGSYPGGPRRR
jgi:hypothetical protein